MVFLGVDVVSVVAYLRVVAKCCFGKPPRLEPKMFPCVLLSPSTTHVLYIYLVISHAPDQIQNLEISTMGGKLLS